MNKRMAHMVWTYPVVKTKSSRVCDLYPWLASFGAVQPVRVLGISTENAYVTSHCPSMIIHASAAEEELPVRRVAVKVSLPVRTAQKTH
jgi:hypothetical protein